MTHHVEGPIYPDRYRPDELALSMVVTFEGKDGTVYAGNPLTLVSGTAGTYVFHIRNDGERIGPGGSMYVFKLNIQLFHLLQGGNAAARDFCTLEVDSDAHLRWDATRHRRDLFYVIVEDGVFKPGDSLTFRIGDRRRGGAGSEVFWAVTQGELLLAADTDGSGTWRGVKDNPFLMEVTPHPQPRCLRLLGPTVAAVGERFDLHLGVFDRSGNLIPNYADTVSFEASDAVHGLPRRLTMSPSDGGLKILPGVSATETGVHRLGVRGERLDETFVTNPIVVQENPDQRIYWGDVHAHGWGDVTMYFMNLRTETLDPLARHRQARDIGRLDFACPGAMSMPEESKDDVWQAYVEACRDMDQPGRYIPFLAYEAHPPAGDRQTFFKDYEGEPAPPHRTAAMTEVEDHYGDRDDVMLEVHIGGEPPRWDRYRPERERMLEVCSGFGAAEWLLQRALQLGYRPAVCGGSDLHLGLMGGPRSVEPFRGRFGQKYPMNQRDAGYGTGPLTAAIAPTLDRESLWTALTHRNTYATSGARIYLDVRCNGQPGGTEMPVEGPMKLAVEVHGCAVIDRIDVIAGTYQIASWAPDTLDFVHSVVLSPDEIPGEWLYVRVHQEDGEYAWSTPFYFPPTQRSNLVQLPAWNAQPEPNLTQFGNNTATAYLDDVRRYLRTEEVASRFQEVTPVRVENASMGTFALFYCYFGDERLPMSIRWFFQFEIPRIRFDWGWRDYGCRDEMELGPQLMKKYR